VFNESNEFGEHYSNMLGVFEIEFFLSLLLYILILETLILLGVINVSFSLLFTKLFNVHLYGFIKLLILLNIDLLILFYCRFKIERLQGNWFSFIYLIIFKKFDPVLYPNEFCSRCSSVNFDIEN
jgi:hypothetical protein